MLLHATANSFCNTFGANVYSHVVPVKRIKVLLKFKNVGCAQLCAIFSGCAHLCAVFSRVTWGKTPPFGYDLSLTYLFASTSEKVTCM